MTPACATSSERAASPVAADSRVPSAAGSALPSNGMSGAFRVVAMAGA